MMAITDALAARPHRVLFLASYFPKLGNEQMGSWALSQAQALLSQGIKVKVVSLTSWVPAVLAPFIGARTRQWATCPQAMQWGSLPVEYPRWLVYQRGLARYWAWRHPRCPHGLGWWSARETLLRTLRAWPADLIFAHNTWTNGDVAERLHRLTGIPFVITDHEVEEITACAAYTDRRRQFQRVFASAAAIVSVGSKLAAETRRLFPDVQPRVIYNGAEDIPASLLGVPRPAELMGKTVLLSVGGMYPVKSFPLLVRSFAPVAFRHPNVVLRIVGDGEDWPEVERTVRQVGLSDRVQLLGAQPHTRVQQEMVWADAFALLSRSDAFGVVFAEAMAAQKPIVCTTGCGVADVVTDGVEGLIVPIDDEAISSAAIERLLRDEPLRRRMGVAGRRLFENRLTWAANARALIELFHNVLPETFKCPAP